jgi:hypothetical protein
MTLRLPAFAAKFRDKRRKGWDPPGVVLVGVDLWLQRQWTRDHVLVVPSDAPVLRLDFRMLAGCQVAVVTALADERLARSVVDRLAACDPARIELIVWDAGRVHEVIAPPPLDNLLAAGFTAGEANQLRHPTYYDGDAHARRYWFTEAQIAARARAAVTERAGLAG